MTSVKDLRSEAKKRKLRGYSLLNKKQLIAALKGEPIYKKNQVLVETQTEFSICNTCGLERYVDHLKFKAAAKEGQIVYDDDMTIDIKTGEIVDFDVDCSKY